MLEKISAAQVDHVLLKTAAALRSQEVEITQLKSQLADYERQQHATKIASAAVDRGIVAEDEAAGYASDLANGNDDLNMVENLVSRSAAGVSLGTTLEKAASVHEDAGGDDVLTTFLLSSEFSG
jgi:hypothetical protein